MEAWKDGSMEGWTPAGVHCRSLPFAVVRWCSLSLGGLGEMRPT
jgi:hypothetical protein